jgi:hypothetical protein
MKRRSLVRILPPPLVRTCQKKKKGFFVVTAVVMIMVPFLQLPTIKLSSTDILQGEAHEALLTARLAASPRFGFILLEEDAILVILAINSPSLFFFLDFCQLYL